MGVLPEPEPVLRQTDGNFFFLNQDSFWTWVQEMENKNLEAKCAFMQLIT